MSDEPKSFRNDLIKIVVEKFLIALILVLAGIYANDIIDKLKSQRSFSTEINKTRAEKIGEVWEKIGMYEGEYEIQNQKILSILNSGINAVFPYIPKTTASPTASPKPLDPELQSAVKDLRKSIIASNKVASQKAYNEMIQILNKNRLWLGEENYKATRDYVELSNKLIDTSLELTSEQRNELVNKRNTARGDIIKIRDELMKDGK